MTEINQQIDNIAFHQGGFVNDNTMKAGYFSSSPVTGQRTSKRTLSGNNNSNIPAFTFNEESALMLDVILYQYVGSSTVAIDNKIEQAMDLVKSHLMFAVREEVEVLKEQIKDLLEKVSQLEYENGILRAAASPETLAKLAQPRPQPPSSSS